MQNSAAIFTLSVLDHKFCPKSQNCQFKVKLDNKCNSNMSNLMMVFTFSL